MKVALASDHAGFLLKESLKPFVIALGHEVVDLGTDSLTSVDYPDFAKKLGLAVVNGEAERGLLL